jgi:signal transduction histidine kinase
MGRIYLSLTNYHDPALVAVACLICFLTSYTVFSLVIRPVGTMRSHFPWIVAAAVVTGGGAWASNLVALLSFRPGLPIGYDIARTLSAGVIAILGSGFGFFIGRSSERLALGGLIIGMTLVASNYVSITALHLPAQTHWDFAYLIASLVLGANLGAAALGRAQMMPTLSGRIISALLLALGILSVHFVGIAGLVITPDPEIAIPENTLAPILFAVAITAVVLLIVGYGFVGTLVSGYIDDIEAAKLELDHIAVELTSALRAANAANEAKSQFLATMSHELRTPLNAIIGFAEVLQREMFGALGDERYRSYADIICTSGTHLLKLINDILDVSRIDAGQLQLREEIVDVTDGIRDCLNLIETPAKGAAVSLSTNLQSPLPLVRADPRRFRQIVLNLLSNAVKFTPAGGRVAVSALVGADGLRIAVADTGIGIAPEDIPKALERFGQIDSKIGRKHQGAGIGLPLAKHLIELHGGTLKIESELGVGTTVSIVIPNDRLLSVRQVA